MIEHDEELRHLRAENATLGRHNARLLAEVATYKAETARLRAALKKYGKHRSGCGGHYDYDPENCQCGLSAALTGALDER